MLFNSIEFAIFLPTVFLLYWFVVNKNLKLQNFFLLVMSYIFYGWWDWRFLSLILFSSFVDYFVGVQLSQQENPKKRKLLLLTYVVFYLDLYTYFLPSKEVYDAIKESKKKNDKVSTLVIGDSVGRQLFDSLNNNQSDSIASLACNQAIDLIGQYLLLKNYLDHNPQVEKVYMVYNPFSFKNNLDHKYTYNYFIKPFYTPEYIPSFTDEAIHQVHKIPYYSIAHFPPIAITFWTPEVYQDTLNAKFLSEISAEYITKMQDLTQHKNVDFEIVPPPIKTSRKEEVEALWKRAKAEKHTELFASLFNNYFDKMFYLPDSLYVDGMHFKNPEKFTTLVMQHSF